MHMLLGVSDTTKTNETTIHPERAAYEAKFFAAERALLAVHIAAQKATEK